MNNIKIKSLKIHSEKEVIHKLTHELIDLFHISLDEGKDEWEIFLDVSETSPIFVKTTLAINNEKFFKEGEGFSKEKPSGAIHRLYKKHLYEILREKFDFPSAPWGILHGVRPTKIVNRFLKDGVSKNEIFEILKNDYLVSEEKSKLLLEVVENEKNIYANDDKNKISVYIGVPFCISKCFYCSFPSYILPEKAKLHKFMEVFKKDLYAAKNLIDKFDLKIENIYIGGGTPTALTDEFFFDMMNLVEDFFVTSDLKEFTLEAGRPDSMSEKKYKIIFDSSVTRVSVNPQTMQNKTLCAIGRKHTPEDIVEMYNNFRQKKNLDINMDLILGLPGETCKDTEDTVKKIADLSPDDITLHALARKRGSPLKLALEENVKVELPSDLEVRKMANVAHTLIRNAFYKPYYLYRQGYMSGQLENIGFSKPGKESVYNVKIIEENQTIIGIGGAATTKVVDEKENRIKAVFNPKDLTTYLRDIDIYINKRNQLAEVNYKNDN